MIMSKKGILIRIMTAFVTGMILFTLVRTGGTSVRVYAAEASDGFDYTSIFNGTFYAQLYPDAAAKYGMDALALYKHFVSEGIRKGEQPSGEFNVQIYMSNYPDIKAAFGDKLYMYYQHYITSGRAEGRIANILLPGMTLLPLPAVTEVDASKLILVNNTHMINSDYVPDLITVNNGKQLEREAGNAAMKMISDAASQGVGLYIVSAYRSYERQAQLYARKVRYYKNLGQDQQTAEASARTVVQKPGSSEHQTGLSMDITDSSYTGLTKRQQSTKGNIWMMAHCAEYGFILRYPENKQSITEVIFEPWHLRYVGVEAAQAIMSQGLCLEEYVS